MKSIVATASGILCNCHNFFSSGDEKRKALERLTMLRKEEKEGVAIKAKVAK